MLKSPISILHEYVAQNRLSMPSYEFKSEGQSHQPQFTCIVKLGNHSVSADGFTKKEAKHKATLKLIEVFNIFLDRPEQMSNICLLPSATKSKINSAPLINYIGKLNEFCAGRQLAQPLYNDNMTICNNKFNIVCILQNFKAEGEGSTKKEAKQDAARNMLDVLRNENLDGMENTLRQEMKYEAPLNINEAIEKYSAIMSNIRISHKEQNEEGQVCEIDMKSIVNKISTWEDLVELFDMKGWSYQLTCFQKSPLMLKLTVMDHVLLQCGYSEKDIQKSLVTEVVTMLKEGTDFDKPPFEH